MKRSISDRLLARLDRSGDCWLWTGHVNKKTGYAQMSVNGKQVYIHRISYEIFRGKLPAGHKLVIDHTCRVRHCANPEHLELVTQQENVRRGNASAAVSESNRRRAEARTHCIHGHELAVTGVYWETNQRGYRVRKCAECIRRRNRARGKH